MLRARSIALTLAAVAAVALAACGGDTAEKNDYVDEVNKVTTTLNSGLTEVSTSATAINSPEQAGDVFAQFGESLSAAATDIDEISPPDDVTELHDKLIESVQTLADEATNAADEIKAGGAAAIGGVAQQFLTEANRLGTEIDSTITEINAKLQG